MSQVRWFAAYGLGIAAVVPRTAGFIAGSWLRTRRAPSDGRPAARPTPRFAARVALDELTLALMNTPGRRPSLEAIERAAADVHAAHEVFVRMGWVEDAASYHRTPPDALSRAIVSGFAPHPEERPGGWHDHPRNRTLHVRVLRHDGAPRPWLVCVHGWGMGRSWMDARAFQARSLHSELGLNVVLPVLPLHGPRSTTRMSGTAFMTHDLVDVGHNLAHAVWDVRRVVRWARAQGAPAVGLYGMSLGAHVASVVSSLEDVDLAVVAIPTCDLYELFERHSPRGLRKDAVRLGLLGEEASRVHRVVTPLASPSRARHRAIFASTGDRLATPSQAVRLWRHWEEPEIVWHEGNHVTAPLSPELRTFVRRTIARALR